MHTTHDVKYFWNPFFLLDESGYSSTLFFHVKAEVVHKTFLGTFTDKTVGFSLKVPRESLIDIVFIGIMDSAGWLNVYVTEQGPRFTHALV